MGFGVSILQGIGLREGGSEIGGVGGWGKWEVLQLMTSE